MEKDFNGSLESIYGDGVKPLSASKQFESKAGPKPLTIGEEQRRKNATEEPSPNYLSDFLDSSDLVKPYDVFEWRRDGVQVDVVKQFILGFYQTGDLLDLHSCSIKEAHSAIWSFIRSSIDNGHRSICIVHGKGLRSKPPAQLKSYVRQVLQQHEDVFAFCVSAKLTGGTGATHVWLRKSEEAKAANRERHQSRKG